MICYFSLLALIGCNKTNWNESFREKDKNPFGTYILYNEARDFLDADRFIYLNKNIYDFLLFDGLEIDTTQVHSYVLIKSSSYKIKKEGLKKLLDLVKKGNTAFIALNYFGKELKEELEFTTNNLDKDIFKNEDLKSQDKIETLFRGIQKDLSEDVLISHYVFDQYMRKDSLKKKFLSNELEDEFSHFTFTLIDCNRDQRKHIYDD